MVIKLFFLGVAPSEDGWVVFEFLVLGLYVCVLKVFVILLLWNIVSCQPFVVLDTSKIVGYTLGVGDFWLHAFHVGASDVCVVYLWVTTNKEYIFFLIFFLFHVQDILPLELLC